MLSGKRSNSIVPGGGGGGQEAPGNFTGSSSHVPPCDYCPPGRRAESGLLARGHGSAIHEAPRQESRRDCKDCSSWSASSFPVIHSIFRVHKVVVVSPDDCAPEKCW